MAEPLPISTPVGTGLPQPVDFPPTSAMIAADPLPKRGRTPACSPVGDDDSQRRTTPYVTYALVGLNVLVFLIELSGGDQFIEEMVVHSRAIFGQS